ncbi:hypothetical protein MRB53_015771 [Persea americana]|uniref:Uncharacterized protein n=1 Tax=Persea americana TaxID=3435 RepID=A0ACC2M1K4_PERAE|nr:hypothetical protein MRB53_015771 [Persea americana]
MKPERDGMDEESMKVLFGEDIAALCDDGFEGSNDERRIFLEILDGNDTGNVSGSSAIIGTTKLEVVESSHTNETLHSNCKCSTEVSLSCAKELSDEDVCLESRCFGCAAPKRRKLFDGPSSHEIKESSCYISDIGKGLFQSEPSKQINSNRNSLDLFCIGETITCFLAESCSEGIISSCVLLRRQGEIDVNKHEDDGESCNKARAASPLGNNVKEVTLFKAIMEPVSQVSSLSKLLSNSAIAAGEEIPSSPTVVKVGPKDSDLSKSSKATVTSIQSLPGQHKELKVINEADTEEVTSSQPVVHAISRERSVSKALPVVSVAASEERPVAPIVVAVGCQESVLLNTGTTHATSGGILLSQHGETDEADDGETSKRTEPANRLGKYVKEVTASKAVVLPISQVSSAAELLPNTDITAVEEIHVDAIVVKKETNEFDTLKSGIDNVASGCVLLMRNGDMDIIEEADYGKASYRTKVPSPREHHVNEVTAMEDITMSLCQERSVSTLLPNSPITALGEMPLIDQEGFPRSMDEADYGRASNKTELVNPHGKSVKEVTASKVTAAPIFQESSVCKIFHNSAVEDPPVAPIVVVEGSKESDILKSGALDATSKRDLKNNFHSHKDKHINLIESSSQDATNAVDSEKASDKATKPSPLERSVKEVDTRRPVCPESSVSQLLQISAVAEVEQKPVSCMIVENRSQEYNLLKSGMPNLAPRSHLRRNCRSIFRRDIDFVDSSSQGIESSCGMLKQSRERDIIDEVNDGKASSDIEVANPCGMDVALANKQRAIRLSVVPQDSSAFTLFLTGAITSVEGKCGALTGIKEGSQEVALKEDHIRDLRPCLRAHISLVLTAAGWGVVTRERKYRPSYFDTIFSTPKEKLICKLPKAWRSCGKSLFRGGIRSVQKENMREWADVNELWSDLSITLAYIEKEMQEVKKSLSLAQRWILLDPFVTAVCIDRRIGVLRSGRAVRVVKGVSIVLKKECDIFFKAKRKDRTKNQLVGICGDHVGRINESLGAALQSATMSNQIDTCFHMTPLVTKHSKWNLSASELKRITTLLGDDSATQYLKQSKPHDMKLAESVCMDKIVACSCTTQRELAPLDLNLEIDEMDKLEVNKQIDKSIMPSEHTQQSEKPSTINQMTYHHPQEEKACHRMIELYKDEVLHQGSTQDIFEVSMLPKLQSSLFQRDFNTEGLKRASHLDDVTGSAFEGSNFKMECASTAVQGTVSVEERQKKPNNKYGHARKKLKRTYKVKSINSSGEHKKVGQAASQSIESQSSNFINLDGEQEDTTPVNLKKCRKCYGSMIASLHKGKLLSVNQQSEGSMAGQQISFIYPHGNLCHRMDGNFHEDVLAHEKTQPAKKCSGMDDEIDNNLEFSSCPEKPIITYVSKFARGAASAGGLEIGLTKTRSKKSRKISEIKATKSYSEHKFSLPMPQMVDSQDVDFTNFDKVYNDINHGQFRNSQKYLMSNIRKGSTKASFVSSTQCQCMNLSKFMSSQTLGSDFKELFAVTHNGKSRLKLKCENTIDEVSFCCAIDESVHPQANRKFSKMKKSISRNENGHNKLSACPIDDDDLLISAIIGNKDFSCNSKQKGARNPKSQKGSCKLLVRIPRKGGKMGGKLSTGTRTVLSWLLDVGVLCVNDVIQYQNPKDGEVVKQGRITRDGLFCNCCNRLLSVSEFKVHAGFKLHRPCLHLFLGSGKPFTVCQLQAWSSEYKARKGSTRQLAINEVDQSDDTCGICADGGELICCDNCPSTYHQSCLSTQDLPEGNWYCSNCTCKICGNVVNKKEASSSLAAFQCSQCEHKYHRTCINRECMNEETASDPWFCGWPCQEVYSGLRSRVGVLNHVADGFAWTLLRCIHGDQKVHSAQKFALMAECNTKLAVALTIMEECFLSMVDSRTGIDMIPHVMYNWGSNFARLNYEGFYTVVLEKGDKLLSVASIRVHGVAVAEMPLIATCSEHRREGMCRRLMNAIEEMLQSFKVQMLVISAIPDLVDTWTSGFGFRPIDGKEKEKLNNINLMVFPGTTLLKKSLNGIEPIKTKQTGLDNELSPRTGISRVDVCSEKNSPVHGLHFARNTGIVGIDPVENPVLQNFRNLQLEEQPDGQLKHPPAASVREPFSTTHAGGEGEDVSSVTCSMKGWMEPLDICGANQLISTKPVVCNEMSVANATFVVSSKLPKEELGDACRCRLSTAEANSAGSLVTGTVDAGNVCHSAFAFHKDETAKLITQHQEAAGGEVNQLELISKLGWSSKYVNPLHASAGMNFSAENALTATSTNKPFVNGEVDASHCRKLNTIYASRENMSLPQGASVCFMEVATTAGGKDALLASQTGSADSHIESYRPRSIQGICEEHSEDRNVSCLLEDAHEHHNNASGQDPTELCSKVGKESIEPSSHCLNQENEGVQENRVDSSLVAASEKGNGDQNELCLVEPQRLASSLKITI